MKWKKYKGKMRINVKNMEKLGKKERKRMFIIKAIV